MLKEHQIRVLEEKVALDEKITKLVSFLDSDATRNLPILDVTLLVEQKDAVLQYSCILATRINRF